MLVGTRRSLLGVGSVADRYSARIQEYSDNLVAHWALDDLSGSVARDRSGNGNHGAVTGATLGQPGIGDGLKSMEFDGTNDYIDISAIASDLIANGGFETAGAGDPDFFTEWSEVGAGAGDVIASEAVNIHTGAKAAKLTYGNNGCFLRGTNIVVVPGEQHEYKFWTRGDGSVAGNYAVYDVTNSAWITASATISTGVTGTTFTMVTYQFTIPAGCVAVNLYVKSPQANGDAYFDTVSLRRTDVPTFDPHEGSMIVWFAGGGLTDSTDRHLSQIRVDANNMISIYDDTTNNRITCLYNANGTVESGLLTISSGFHSAGITWSVSGDAVNYYYDGAVGAAQSTALGVLTGNLDATRTTLGAANTTPANPYLGNLAHAQLYNTPHDADTMKYLMSLPT